jgi:hypothetical protein
MSFFKKNIVFNQSTRSTRFCPWALLSTSAPIVLVVAKVKFSSFYRSGVSVSKLTIISTAVPIKNRTIATCRKFSSANTNNNPSNLSLFISATNLDTSRKRLKSNDEIAPLTSQGFEWKTSLNR